jgi:HlyD family secretion protein
MIRPRLLVPVLAVSALVLAAATVPLLSLGDTAPVPVYRVQRQDFERRVVADGHLSAVRATPLAPDPTVRSSLRIAWMVPDGSRVSAGDPVVRFDPSQMEQRLEDARVELTKTEIEIRKQRLQSAAEVENLGRDEDLAELELETARQFQKKDAELFSRQEIIEAEMDRDLAEQRKEHAEKERRSRQALATTEIQLLEIDRRRAREKIEEAETRLASMEILAPHDGLVVFQRDFRGNLPRIGDQVYPGNPVAEIPDLSEMQAEVYVLEADAGGLAEGKPARIRLEAHPEVSYEGVVERVDALAKPRMRESPVQYFSVILRLRHTEPERMKPGERVRATLLLERVENALVVPRQAVFERGGAKVVFRRDRDGFETVPVTLGAVGLGRVVVESGISEGDVLALADPGGSPDGVAEDRDRPHVSPGLGGVGAP